jgi:hypothetical protein
MTNEEHFRYLTEPLREVARSHLESDEQVLTAIYVERDSHLVRVENQSLKRTRVMRLPRRAFVLTTRRALIVEDPTDPAATRAQQDHLVALCPLEWIIYFELRSHLLDCAPTLVWQPHMAQSRSRLPIMGSSGTRFSRRLPVSVR